MDKPRAFFAFPGGASHCSTIAGAALGLCDELEPAGCSGVSAGFLVAVLVAFGKLDQAPALLTKMLQKNRVLDIKHADGNLGLCAWQVVPDLVDELLGPNVRMGDSPIPLVGVVTSADTGRPLYLSKKHAPKVLVRDVARATSAIVPLASMVTMPSMGTDLSPDRRLFFDGGFTDNLPDHVFDVRPEPTISLSLGADDSIVRVPTFAVEANAGFLQAMAVVRAVTFAQCQRKSRRADVDGVHVNLHAVGSGLDFNLTSEVIAARIARGRAAIVQAAAEKRLPVVDEAVHA